MKKSFETLHSEAVLYHDEVSIVIIIIKMASRNQGRETEFQLPVQRSEVSKFHNYSTTTLKFIVRNCSNGH